MCRWMKPLVDNLFKNFISHIGSLLHVMEVSSFSHESRLLYGFNPWLIMVNADQVYNLGKPLVNFLWIRDTI